MDTPYWSVAYPIVGWLTSSESARPTKGGKGLLSPGWMEREKDIMVAYKMCTISCTYFGISGTVEDFLEGYEYNLFKSSHRKFFCWINEWSLPSPSLPPLLHSSHHP